MRKITLEQAKAALTRFEKDQLNHDKAPSKGRGAPEFGMKGEEFEHQ